MSAPRLASQCWKMMRLHVMRFMLCSQSLHLIIDVRIPKKVQINQRCHDPVIFLGANLTLRATHGLQPKIINLHRILLAKIFVTTLHIIIGRSGVSQGHVYWPGNAICFKYQMVYFWQPRTFQIPDLITMEIQSS